MPPWEKYQGATLTQEAGPWERYGGKAPPAARGVLGTVDDTVRMLANGATFGFADEIAAKLGSATGIGGNAGDYQGNLSSQRERDDDIMARMPLTSMIAKMVGAVASPVTKVIGSGVNAVRAPGLINYAMQGGLGGSLAGAGESTEGNRGAGALTGGAFGTAFGVAFPAAINGLSALGRGVANRFTAPSTQASRKIVDAFARDGLSVDDAVSQLQTLGDDAAIADLGGNVRGLAEAAAQQPGAAAKAAEQLRVRQFGQGDRLTNGALKILGAESLDDLIAQRAAKAGPLYEKAFSSQVPVYNDKINRLLQSPEIKKGIKQGIQIVANEADAMGAPVRLQDYAITGFNEAGDPIIGGVPTLRLLDAAKRGLDDILQSGGERVRDPVKNSLTQYGRSIDGLRRALINEMDGLTDGTYKAARQAWSGPSDVIEAVSLINKTVETARDGSDITGRLFGSPAAREKLRKLFPDKPAFDRFAKLVQAEKTYAETTRQILGNSRTAFRQAAQDEMAGGAIDAAFNVAQNPTMANVLGQGAIAARNWMKRPPTEVADQLSPLFSTDPAIRDAAMAALRQRVGGQALMDKLMLPLRPGGPTLTNAARAGGYSGGQLGAYR